MKNKSKYLLNVNGKRYRSNTFIKLLWNFLTGKTDKK